MATIHKQVDSESDPEKEENEEQGQEEEHAMFLPVSSQWQTFR